MKKVVNIKQGFTIVELLIVVVVIAILAAITVVAYNGIQNRAYDTSVQADLNNIAKQILSFNAKEGRLPQGSTDLSTLDLKASSRAYGIGMLSGGSYYNLLYCWPNTSNPNKFALVAESKSSKVFEYIDGTVREASYTYLGGSLGICQKAGITLIDGNSRDWFYAANNWQGYVKV